MLKIKNTLSIFLAVLLLLSVTATAVSATYTLASTPKTNSYGGPQVSFTAEVSKDKDKVTTNVMFYDYSIGGYWKWWDFGDGTSSESRLNDNYHSYKRGFYKVTLKETDILGYKSNIAYINLKIK